MKTPDVNTALKTTPASPNPQKRRKLGPTTTPALPEHFELPPSFELPPVPQVMTYFPLNPTGDLLFHNQPKTNPVSFPSIQRPPQTPSMPRNETKLCLLALEDALPKP